MGVDCRISLPANVRVGDVVDVLGRLLGAEATLRSLDRDGVAVHVSGVSVKTSSVPEMASLHVLRDGEDVLYWYYHFESPGGRRLTGGRSTARNIALSVALADFFGGRVTYTDYEAPRCKVHTDCLEHPALGEACQPGDYVVPDKDDSLNHPTDGEPWNALQRRIAALEPLRAETIGACATLAAYTDDR